MTPAAELPIRLPSFGHAQEWTKTVGVIVTKDQT